MRASAVDYARYCYQRLVVHDLMLKPTLSLCPGLPGGHYLYKERKTNKPLLLFGEGIDVEGGARSQAKTPWEGDVLLNFDALV